MASAIPFSRHRLSVEQFEEMARVGILAHDARVELIDGELIDMAPIGSRHASVVAALTMCFARQGGDVLVWPQCPIVLPPRSEPQPDLAILVPQARGYRDALPRAEDILLVIEVSDTTVRYDRLVKGELYARYGIREFWLVNLPEAVLEVHSKPETGAYRTHLVLSGADIAVPEALPGVGIRLDALFLD